MLIMKHKNNNKIPIAMLTTKHTAIDNVSIKNFICKNQKLKKNKAGNKRKNIKRISIVKKEKQTAKTIPANVNN